MYDRNAWVARKREEERETIDRFAAYYARLSRDAAERALRDGSRWEAMVAAERHLAARVWAVTPAGEVAVPSVLA